MLCMIILYSKTGTNVSVLAGGVGGGGGSVVVSKLDRLTDQSMIH